MQVQKRALYPEEIKKLQKLLRLKQQEAQQ